jgi:predicted metal-dependent HD superfamily phosphohydrolase
MAEYRELWGRFWRQWQARRTVRPSGPLSEGEVWAVLVQHYTSPGRAYHTLEHVAGMVRQVRELRGSVTLGTTPEPELRGVDFDALELAAWFHDAVHAVGAEDNEARSADLACGAARAMGFSDEQIEQVRSMVRDSAHAGPASSYAGRLLCDIDLVLLGLPWEQFTMGVELIRRECAPMPKAAAHFERAVMFRALLARPAIYQTALFRDRLEERARENLTRAVAELGRSLGLAGG